MREHSLRDRLIPLLADGRFHSGEQLARTLDVSRTAVWKALAGLEELGIEVHRVPKRGYRLAHPLELLDAALIEHEFALETRARLHRLDVFLRTDSTNTRLLETTDLAPGKAAICMAESQSAGRGRRGRVWVAPFGSSLCLSIGWLFPETPPQLSALSLAAGVGVLRALRKLGPIADLGLKWPNDVLLARRKLGGILIELRAESAGPSYVVIGLGLNLQLSTAVRESLNATGLEVAALSDGLQAQMPGRNRLAAGIVDSMLEVLAEFQQHGFTNFAKEWREADALSAAPARVMLGDTQYQGIARGIDADGALLLETPGKLLRFTSGEVSLRPET